MGWPEGGKPQVYGGLTVGAFAAGLDHPCWNCVRPNGDVLVAETNAPERPDGSKGPRAWIQRKFMKKAGANRITLLRDTNGDGVADERSVFASGLRFPFGMVLVAAQESISNADAELGLFTTAARKQTPAGTMLAGKSTQRVQ